jgi:hypothetical protein
MPGGVKMAGLVNRPIIALIECSNSKDHSGPFDYHLLEYAVS